MELPWRVSQSGKGTTTTSNGRSSVLAAADSEPTFVVEWAGREFMRSTGAGVGKGAITWWWKGGTKSEPLVSPLLAACGCLFGYDGPTAKASTISTNLGSRENSEALFFEL